MELAEPILDLMDAKQRQLGHVTPESITGDLIAGVFVPGPDFPAIAKLFRKFEEAVNVQALSVVDELDTQIAALNLRLYLPGKTQFVKIHDVQIWSDGNFTCRLSDVAIPTIHSLFASSKNGQLTTLPHPVHPYQ